MWLAKHILKYEIIRQFIKFSLIGFINTVIDFLVYLILTRVFNFYFVVANVVAIVVAMCFSFIFNKYWTFRNNERAFKKQSLKFVFVNIIYFILNNSIVYGLVSLKFFDIIAKLIATIIGLFWSFAGNRYWTFAKNK